MIPNERGVALVITLLVVSLLVITVMEFTYSVFVDQHMARNALSGLQASLLARSGINLGEAFLLHDDDPKVDAFSEEWCPLPDNEGQSCALDDTNSQLILPDNMRLRVQIFDESGKLNINLVGPQSQNDCALLDNLDDNPNATDPFRLRLNALGRLLDVSGEGTLLLESFEDYWRKVCDALGAVPTVGPQGTAAPANAGQIAQIQAQRFILGLRQQQFGDLDDLGRVAEFTPSVIRRLRPALTAQPTTTGVSPSLNAIAAARQLNANTASRRVLMAILDDEETVDQIIAARQDAPLDLGKLGTLGGALPPEKKAALLSMLGVASSLFRIHASAIVNANPVTGRGGIGRSASMLVRRVPRPGVPLNAPAGTAHWTLTQLDWQKEGGAALFQPRPDQEPAGDEPASDRLGMGG